MRKVAVLAALILAASAAAQKPQFAELQLRADGEARVRPLESIAIQAVAYGTPPEGAGSASELVRMQLGGAEWTLAEGGGWLSKPFRFQGEEAESFWQPPEKGLSSLLFRQARGQFLLQDAALYTAPEREGTYEVRATLEGKTASIMVKVEQTAPSRKPAEETTFNGEPRDLSPYRPLVEHWSPLVAQETWFQPKSDYLARFDLDGDWAGDNNWEHAETGSSQAYGHYAVMETETHWFLHYNFFHPRDYSDKCVAGSCHENDNEGTILTVRKDGTRFGKLEAMETLAHNNVYSYVADPRIRGGEHGVDGEIELADGSHPVIFIESGGHGNYGSTGSHSRYSVSEDRFTAGTGVTFSYKGTAERPRHPDDRRVGYELLPIWDHWWLRAHEGTGRQDKTFDAYYRYVPEGGRPKAAYAEIAGSFLGRAQSENKAKPFWGWHDNRTRKKGVLATGQWALDPAYAVARNLRFPEPVSTTYVFNPYLGIGEATQLTGVPSSVRGAAVSGPPRATPTQPSRQALQSGGGSIWRRHIEALQSK